MKKPKKPEQKVFTTYQDERCTVCKKMVGRFLRVTAGAKKLRIKNVTVLGPRRTGVICADDLQKVSI